MKWRSLLLVAIVASGGCRSESAPTKASTPRATDGSEATPEAESAEATPGAQATPNPQLDESLGPLFPPGGRDGLAEVRAQVVAAAAELPAGSMAEAENRRVQELISLVVETVPGFLASNDYNAALSALERGIALAQSIVKRNLDRFWEIKRALDRDDDSPMPDDVRQVEIYNKNAQLSSSLAAVCTLGVSAYLEGGELDHRRTALATLESAYARSIKLAGGAPVLQPGPQTTPLQMVATGHASKIAGLIAQAAKGEKDETLRAEFEATLASIDRDAPAQIEPRDEK